MPHTSGAVYEGVPGEPRVNPFAFSSSDCCEPSAPGFSTRETPADGTIATQTRSDGHPDPLRGACEDRRWGGRRRTKVGDDGAIVIRHENIVGLEIKVHHTLPAQGKGWGQGCTAQGDGRRAEVAGGGSVYPFCAFYHFCAFCWPPHRLR